MNMTSVWTGTSRKAAFPALDRDLSVDVAVIGGGITGVTAAMLLARAGKKVAVLEAGEVGSGATGHSTGNLYALLSHHLFTVGEKWDDQVMQNVAQSRAEAVDSIEQTVRSLSIDCHFARRPWHLYTTAEGKQHDETLEKEYQAAAKAGLHPQWLSQLPLPLQIDKAIRVDNQAQIDPFAYTQGLAKAVASQQCQVFTHTRVIGFDAGKGVVETTGGKVSCQQILLATHTPKGINVVQAEMEPGMECGIAVRLADNQYPEGIFWGYGKERHSIRSFDADGQKYLLVIGEMFHTGHEKDVQANIEKLEAFTRSHFKVNEISFRWLAQNFRPADRLPYIGSSLTEGNLYIATGFSTDGLTYGTLAAMIISDAILGKQNPWRTLYDATRFDPIKAGKEALKENLHVAEHLAKGYLSRADVEQAAAIQPGEGALVELNGEKLAVYRNDSGNLTAVSSTCTHMGCKVHWNNAAKTWDCPCHGSRYDTDGQVIEGPAINNLERKVIQS